MTNQKKPKIAIYYENRLGRNDGPPLYWLNVLKNQLQLDVTHLLPEGDTSSYGKFDYHFWIDYGEDGLPGEQKNWYPPKDGGTTIYVASDTHLGPDYRFERAKHFDYVFFNQKQALDDFTHWAQTNQSFTRPSFWLPHAAEPQAYPKFNILKKYDVCFIGHFQDEKNYNGITRIDALDRLFKEFPNFYFGTRTPQDPSVNVFEDAAKKFCQSKIVFNISIRDDINMRFWEAMMTGSFLLTNWLPTLKELEPEYGMKEGKHYVTYKTLDEMIEKSKYYLSHDDERETIANAAYEQSLKTGTYYNRCLEVLKVVGYPVYETLINTKVDVLK